jgi:hypothetical protein
MAEPTTPTTDLRAAVDLMRLEADYADQKGRTAILDTTTVRILADLITAIADEMADYPAATVHGGIGIHAYPDQPHPIWTTAHTLATTWRGKERP